jgi:Tfp pilus assembly protein PilF
MALARNFSIDKKIFYIDSNIIGWAILRSGYPLPSTIDTQKIMNAIEAAYENVQRIQEPENKEMIPLTEESDHMLKTAGDYGSVFNDKSTTPDHVLLALLSYDNIFRRLLNEQGWVYHEQLKNSFGNRKDWEKVKKRNRPVEIGIPSVFGFLRSKKKKEEDQKELLYKIWMAYTFCSYDDCIKGSAQLLKYDAVNKEGLIFIGYSYLAKRQFPEAIKWLEKTTRLYPEIDPLMALAHCYGETGSHDKAIQLYKQCLEINPGEETVLNNIGFTLSRKGSYNDAITYFDQSIIAKPGFAYPYNNKGYALLKMGRLPEAKQLILHSIGLNKGNSYAFKNLALCFIEEGNKAEALQWLEKARLYDYAELYGSEVDDLIKQLKR